ncbi:hypothetical protein [Pontibacter oryzae]|uniref:Uncharacterized protein n=1 Tax=Pontibacter oryzae TaxID=2304593 RepID=A0A399SMW5_9BACT|nr:hypothetical protein D1627_00170 [Pontibacter oryzae]
MRINQLGYLPQCIKAGVWASNQSKKTDTNV